MHPDGEHDFDENGECECGLVDESDPSVIDAAWGAGQRGAHGGPSMVARGQRGAHGGPSMVARGQRGGWAY